jgi:hypothetical protein
MHELYMHKQVKDETYEVIVLDTVGKNVTLKGSQSRGKTFEVSFKNLAKGYRRVG